LIICSWTKLNDVVDLEPCYPERNGDKNEIYCSGADGHEYGNNGGFFTCQQDEMYPIPTKDL
jgi:hypothetical protein